MEVFDRYFHVLLLIVMKH